MKINSTRFVFPVLLEKLPPRTPSEERISALDADIAIGTLEIDTHQKDLKFHQHKVLAETAADEMEPRLMNDGRVAYRSGAHGHPTIYVRKEDKHAQPLAPHLEVTSHAVSPNGETLVFTDKSGWVRKWDAKDGVSKPLFKTDRRSSLLGFDHLGDSLLIACEDSKNFRVLEYDMVDRASEVICRDHSKPGAIQFTAAVSPEGKSVSILRGQSITHICLQSGNKQALTIETGGRSMYPY